MTSLLRSVTGWLGERLPLEGVTHLAAKKTVPVHRYTVFYFFGGMTLFLFGIQVVTGLLLLLYYRASADEAFESVQFIMTEVEFGWLIRSIHSWSANLMILTLYLHFFSVLFTKSYRRPRELTWITGILLMGLMLAFGFSGYLLPWNQLAYFATKVGTEVVGVLPLVGEWLLAFLRGGPEVGAGTLTRFFALHVVILPFLSFALLGLHLFLIQRQGMSLPPGMAARAGGRAREIPFLPNFLLRDLQAWLVALAALAALAALFPWELGVKADPLAPAPAGIKPEWFFLFMFETLKIIPAKVLFLEGEVLGVLGFGAGFALLLLVPFIDNREDRPLRSRMVTVASVVVFLYVVAFTLYGMVA